MRKLFGTLALLFVLTACSSDDGSQSGATAQVSPPTPGTQEDLVANVGDRVFFDFDRSEIRPDQKQQLDAIAAWLKTYSNVNVLIEGHADERGTREYNYALGERRAHAAAKYLVQQGIDKGRISTTSFGKDRPAVLGSDEAAWAKNRRAVVVVQ